tara:strand:- start:851 stop:1156 length:306 start_codon:yes stop_codon:yes gene_type:complete
MNEDITRLDERERALYALYKNMDNLDDERENTVTRIVKSYVKEIGAAKTIELFVELDSEMEFVEGTTSQDVRVLEIFGLNRIITSVLFYLEGTLRHEDDDR